MSVSVPVDAEARPRPELVVEPTPMSWREWFAQQWAHRGVLLTLARSDFHVRYKRASFGVLWAVAVPAVQAAALAVVFSRFVPVEGGFSYAAFAVSGVLAWGYFGPTLGIGSVAIVEGSELADKVWFPRSILVLAPCLANIPGLVISALLFISILPLLGGEFDLRTALLVPAALLLVAFTTALSLCLAALHVYFRDVRHLVQASLLVLFYVTPIVYPQTALGGLGPWLDLNPITGIVNLFHFAAVGMPEAWTTDLTRSIIVSALATIALIAVASEAHRRHDRLFVDLL
jgi:ABC-type polysaccharide/polyol phosphate export permease